MIKAPKRPGSSVPPSLSLESAKLWNELTTAYAIDDLPGKILLQTALESLDRMRAAQAAMAVAGMIVKTARGGLAPHPGVKIESDSRAAMLSAMKMLNLEIYEPTRPGPGRPPGR